MRAQNDKHLENIFLQLKLQRYRTLYNDDTDGGGSCHSRDSSVGAENNFPLHKMRPPEKFIEAEVQDSDTLQAMSLRFHCSVQELKRINRIHKENEIFARKTLKVPVTAYSILTETFSRSQNDISSSSIIGPDDAGLPNNNVLDKSSEPVTGEIAVDCNATIMNSKIISTVPYKDDPSEENNSDTVHLLHIDDVQQQMHLGVEAVVVKEFTRHGADFGIKWIHLVICILVIGFIVPLIYVFYIAEHLEHTPDEPGH